MPIAALLNGRGANNRSATLAKGVSQSVLRFPLVDTGWVGGGGVEYMATEHVLMRIEYL